MTAPALEARSLVRRFGDKVAVDHVDFTVEFGEVVGLLGANGAGKTTTIRMLSGLLDPTSGSAHLLGRPPDRASQRRLGYVPQGLGLYTDLTVRENLAFTAVVYDVEPAPLTGALADAADRLVRELPLGLQRQLAFVAAVQHRPDVMILDEPTSGVGALSAARLWDRIRSSAEGGAAVLVSTHSMDEARQCDRLLLMADGRIVAGGTEEDIVAGMTVVEVTAGAWSEAFETLVGTGALVTLAGRVVRVVDRDAGTVEEMLAAGGIASDVRVVPATIDETMASLSLLPTGT
jgi:ABC-2 type transport system ATP-binding protein/ribosome-dependent ATPase